MDLSWFRRRQQAGLRPYDKPSRERHFVSVACSSLSAVLLLLALSLQEWGKAETSKCKFTFKLTQVVVEDKPSHHDYHFKSKWSRYNHHLSFSLFSDRVLQQQPADLDLVCDQCVVSCHHILPHLHHHQCWLPQRETRVHQTLRCLQHHLTYVLCFSSV